MAFRYTFKSGDVIEADTAEEIQQLRNLPNQKSQHKGAFILGVSAMLEVKGVISAPAFLKDKH